MIAGVMALAYFAGAGLLVIGLNELMLIPWRRARDAHWTERARRLFPVRTAAILHLLYVPAILAVLGKKWWPHCPLEWPGILASAFVGAQLGTFFCVRAVFPSITFRIWLADIGVTYLFRIMTWAPMIFAAITMPPHFNGHSALLAGAAIGVQIAFLRGLGLKIGALLGVIYRAPARVDRIVAELAAATGIGPPRILVTRSLAANAFALPHLGMLIFTSRLLDECSDEEITAITAHEIAHLTEPPGVIRVRVLSAFILTPLIFVRPAFTQFKEAGIFTLLALLFLANRLARRLARRMEHRADTLAVAHSGPDPAVYAHALEHLYRLNQMPAVMRGARLIHPHLYDRLIAAGVLPDYPRPRPPAHHWWTQSLLTIALLIAMFERGFFR